MKLIDLLLMFKVKKKMLRSKNQKTKRGRRELWEALVSPLHGVILKPIERFMTEMWQLFILQQYLNKLG